MRATGSLVPRPCAFVACSTNYEFHTASDGRAGPGNEAMQQVHAHIGGGGRAVNNHWTGLLEWTTGLTFLCEIIFMAYNEISCQYMHYIGF